MPASTDSPSGPGTARSVLERYVAMLRADRPVLLSFVVFLAAGGLLLPLSLDYWQNEPEFLINVLAEAHGMLLDLLVFGCLLLWFEKKAAQRRRIETYRNTINDFLGWESNEAMHRIVGNIRRLNRAGAAPETLKQAYLEHADLKGVDLSEASLNGATLAGADLEHADLTDTYLGNADFTDANLRKADLAGAHFGIFAGMPAAGETKETALSGANLRAANLRGIRNATAETFRNVETLYKARLDSELKEEIEAEYPDLLEPRAVGRPE